MVIIIKRKKENETVREIIKFPIFKKFINIPLQENCQIKLS